MPNFNISDYSNIATELWVLLGLLLLGLLILISRKRRKSRESIIKKQVSNLTPPVEFLKFQNYTNPITNKKSKILSLMSYNILQQKYMLRNDHLKPKLTKENRLKAVAQEILELLPDIICLQEVDLITLNMLLLIPSFHYGENELNYL